MDKQRRTATEEPPWRKLGEGGEGGLISFNSHEISPEILIITKTYLYNFDPFKPYFSLVKLL